MNDFETHPIGTAARIAELETQGFATGYALAMRVLQSDLYKQLDPESRAECDALIAAGMAALRQV